MNIATSLVKIPIYCCLALLLLCTACGGEDQEPAYLQLNGFNFTTTNGQGAATEDITAVWVFIGTEFFGAFRPDARIPMLKTGSQEVRFEFGVQENGRASTPNIYDFYQPVTRTIDLVPGAVTEVAELDVRYKDDINFAIIEGFENNENRVFDLVLTGATTLNPTGSLVRSGQFAGKIELTRDSTTFEVATETLYEDLIGDIGQVWLEVDYISDVPVVWGVVAPLQSGEASPRRFYDPGFVARNNWTKIYFNLTGVIVSSRLNQYRFGFSAFINDLEQQTGTVYLDNIKVLYF